MNYEAIEDEIIAKLENSAVAEIASCMALPDSISEYQMPQKKGLVTVVFFGEKFDKNQSIGDVSQHYTLTFNVAVQARLLRGDRGVYAISNLVKAILVGFMPSNCGRLNLSEHAFAGYQNEVWEHSLTFSCTSLRTQDEHEPLPDNDITDGEEVFYDPSKLTVNNCNS